MKIVSCLTLMSLSDGNDIPFVSRADDWDVIPRSMNPPPISRIEVVSITVGQMLRLR